MRNKTVTIFMLAVFFLSSLGSAMLFSQDDLMSGIKEAKDWQGSVDACVNAIRQCKSYEDYEKLISGMKSLIPSQRDYKYADILNYMIAKARVGELYLLTKKNDIESGRIYMSVNEKYYNEALEYLEKAENLTKSKDLGIDIYFLRFIIFKELFQPQKVDAVFNEMINRIVSYGPDGAKNLDKLNEISKKFSERDMTDYAMKLKLLYASKVGPEGAKAIAEEIKLNADTTFDEGNTKGALTTYDSYLQVAENYYDKETIAAKIMDIAEKYFNKGFYKDAIKYYSLYLFKYSDSKVANYASYKLALSLYYERDYARAINRLEEFLKTYQNSAWFEKAFETLSRLYYESLSIEEAIANLQKLIDAYPRRDTRDYAHLLIGILYYNANNYDKALEVLKSMETDFPRSAYLYAAGLLIQDINEIREGAAPAYSFGSKDVYKVWEPYMPIGADIAVEGAEVVENKEGRAGDIYVKAKPGSKITFLFSSLDDIDRFSEYLQDKEDESRLPRKIKDQTEKDIVFFTWSSAEGGKFLDDKESISKAWQAPSEPGTYTITVNIGDLGLVRPPDSGSKKDSAKTLTVHVTVEK